MVSLAGFNWLDIGIFALAVVSLAIGFAQGLLRQVIGLAALYIATILGAQYYVPLTNFIKNALFIQSSKLLNSIAFLVIVVVVWLLLTWLAYDAYRSTKIQIFPLIDQLGGSVLSLVALTVAIVMLLPVLRFMITDQWTSNEPVRQAIAFALEGSRLVPIFAGFKEVLLNAITPWMPYGLPGIFNL